MEDFLDCVFVNDNENIDENLDRKMKSDRKLKKKFQEFDRTIDEEKFY